MKPIFIYATVLLAALVSQTVSEASSIVGNEDDFVEFIRFQRQFGKVYESQEVRRERFETFKRNLRVIRRHNQRTDVTYTMGVTQFADLSAEEFKQIHLQGYKRSPRLNLLKVQLPEEVGATEADDLPRSVDWRQYLTPVKNQGGCGSCWAFGTVEQVEAYFAMANNGSKVVLAPQQLVSCMDNPAECGGTGGCKGATAELGLGYISKHGIVAESDLPYESGTSGDDETCPSDLSSAIVTVQDFRMLPSNNLMAVKKHLAKVGPLAVNLDSSHFRLYTGGVFAGCDYDQDIDINHVVQLVGYGTDLELGDYWLIRNSWGPEWGENGFIRIQRESEEICGFDSRPQDGVGCHGQTETVKVCGMCGVLYDTVFPLGVQEAQTQSFDSVKLQLLN